MCRWFINFVFYYFAETKSQFARDDPAFLVLLLASLCCKLSAMLKSFQLIIELYFQSHRSGLCSCSTSVSFKPFTSFSMLSSSIFCLRVSSQRRSCGSSPTNSCGNQQRRMSNGDIRSMCKFSNLLWNHYSNFHLFSKATSTRSSRHSSSFTSLCWYSTKFSSVRNGSWRGFLAMGCGSSRQVITFTLLS